MSQQPSPVIVVGAGIAGVSCARVLHEAGVPVRVLDRGRAIGGRMAVRHLEGRVVDMGASYLTAAEPEFLALVSAWRERGLARPWTDTFFTAEVDGLTGGTSGPLRWAAPGGLRSLVEDLASDLPVEHPVEVEKIDLADGVLTVDGVQASAVVLAMPDPQARDLLPVSAHDERLAVDREWEAVISVAIGWDERDWPELDAAFVNGSPVLGFLADDGARRGDGAAVLTAHTTSAFAARYLDDPEACIDEVVAATAEVLGIEADPTWTLAHRWGLARPTANRGDPFFLGERRIGLCGDGWHGRSRIEGAWLSGRKLGRALVDRLG